MASCAPRQLAARLARIRAVARLPLRAGALLLIVAALCVHAVPAAAQVTWEYSPYDIEVWVDFSAAPEFTQRFQQDARRQLEQLAEIEVGAPWTLTATPLPAATRGELLAYLERAADLKVKSLKRPEGELRKVLSRDKLVLAEVESVPGGYRVRVQELDCRTRTWGSVIETIAWQHELIPYAICEAAIEAFVPFARIESVKDKEAQARLRAGGLLLEPSSAGVEGTSVRPSPVRVADGSVLRPMMRRNDRYGEPRPGGIQPAPWTFLRVQSHSGAVLQCEVSSGVRGALGGPRSNPRNERLALVVKPRGETTRLVLQTRGTSPLPLVGYEIYEPSKNEEPSRLLGVTDWRGGLDVERGDSPLRVLIVKSGGQLLARLPLVPGLTPQEQAEIPDDQKRLEAEGAVMGLNSSFMDVVARREVLAARVRRKIAGQDFIAAQTLIDELRVLDSRTNLSERLDQYQRDYTSPDKRVQTRIDKMFTETRALFNKHLNPRLADQLTGELNKAKGGRS